MIPPCTAHRLMLTGAQARHYQYTDRVEAMHHAQTPELLMLAYDGNPPPGATRADCVAWLDKHGLEVPPKSACTFCPYRNTAEWRRIKATPEDWKEAVEVDNAIRKARPPYDLFVHPARIPLEDVDLRTETERGQLSLWDNECGGICGV